MQTHKNKVIETNNAESRKHTHTHSLTRKSTHADWDRERYNDRERASSSVKNEASNDDLWARKKNRFD